MRRLRRVTTEPPFSAASMSPLTNGEPPEEVRLAYDSMRARLEALGSSSSAGVPFGAIVSCECGTIRRVVIEHARVRRQHARALDGQGTEHTGGDVICQLPTAQGLQGIQAQPCWMAA